MLAHTYSNVSAYESQLKQVCWETTKSQVQSNLQSNILVTVALSFTCQQLPDSFYALLCVYMNLSSCLWYVLHDLFILPAFFILYLNWTSLTFFYNFEDFQ